MRTLLLPLFAAAPLAACTSSDSNAVPLASISGLTVNVTAAMGDTPRPWISVWLSYDDDGDCLAVSVDATINGGAFDVSDGGGELTDERPVETEFGPGTQYSCTLPEFDLETLPAGPTSIHLADDSATVDVVLPDLTAPRSISLSGSSALVIGEPVTLVPDIPTSDRGAFFYITATPAVVCDDGISLFGGGQDAPERAVPEYLTFDIPSECPDLASMPTELGLTIEASPQTTTCSGAACKVTVSSTHDQNVTFEAEGSD